jgi:hypothetical protein
MDPQAIERARESVNILRAILEGVKLNKEYELEILKGQREIREDLRNLDNLRPLRGVEKAKTEIA